MTNNLLRQPAVSARVGLAKSTLHVHVAQGILPSPISCGPRARAWIESEINAVIAARIAGSTPDEIKQLVAKLTAARTRAS